MTTGYLVEIKQKLDQATISTKEKIHPEERMQSNIAAGDDFVGSLDHAEHQIEGARSEDDGKGEHCRQENGADRRQTAEATKHEVALDTGGQLEVLRVAMKIPGQHRYDS